MSADFQVNQNQPIQAKNMARSVEQKFESKLSQYAKSTSRVLPESKDVQQSITQLKNQTMTLKSFVKNLLGSSSTSDLANIETLTKELGLEVARDVLPQKTAKQSRAGASMQNKGTAQSKSQQTMPEMGRSFDIIQTSASSELTAGNVVKMVKEGKGKQASTTVSNKPEVLGKVLSSFSSIGQLNQVQVKALMSLLENVLVSEGLFPPEMMEEVRKKLKKCKKALDELDEAAEIDEADIDGLSEDAKNFVRDLKKLTAQVGQLPGEMPSELADAYSSLLAKLGVEES